MSYEKEKKRIVYNLCLAVLICIFLGSAGYLAYYFLQSKKSEDQFQKLEAMIDAPVNEEEIVYVATDGDAEPGLEFVNIDGTRVQKSFASLYRENHDFIGWLSIEDTNIDYPVYADTRRGRVLYPSGFLRRIQQWQVRCLLILKAMCRSLPTTS